jgi:hypothetical protein
MAMADFKAAWLTPRAADQMEPVLKQKNRLAAVSPKSDQVF